MGIPVSRVIAAEETKTTEETPQSGLVKGQTLFQMMQKEMTGGGGKQPGKS